MIRRTIVVIAIAWAAFAMPAAADLYLFDDPSGPQAGNSWSQRFTITDTGTDSSGSTDTFDELVITHIAGTPFEAPGIDNFSPPSPFASVTYNDALQVIQAAGTDVGTLAFDLHFTGDAPTSQVWFQLSVFDVVYVAGVPSRQPGLGLMGYWNGVDWYLGIGDSGQFSPLNVPVPAAVLLGMLGMAAAGWRLRRMC